MGHGTSSLLAPTSGSSTQAELVGMASGSGFRDLKLRSIGLGTDAVANQLITVDDSTGSDYVLRVMAGSTEMMNVKAEGSIRLGYTSSQIQSLTSCAGNAASTNPGGITGYNYDHSTVLSTSLGGGGDGKSHADVMDLNTMALGVGGGLAFGGAVSSNTIFAYFAGLKAAKENSTVSDITGCLAFWTSPNGAPVERARFLGSTSTLQGRSDLTYAWTSGASSATRDTGLSRTAVGVVAVGNGTNGDKTGTLVAALVQDANTNLRNVSAALAQNATNGFLFAPSCLTGAPSGAPALGNGALVVGGDNQLYCRLNGAWSQISGASTPTTLGKVTTYNGIATAGNGLPAIVASNRLTGQTAASGNVVNFTPASDATLLVCCEVEVTASTTFSFTLECAYQDPAGNLRILNIPMTPVGGTFQTALTNAASGVGSYQSAVMRIRARGGQNMVIRTQVGGTYTSVTYNVEASIMQIA